VNNYEVKIIYCTQYITVKAEEEPGAIIKAKEIATRPTISHIEVACKDKPQWEVIKAKED
jgi:hypothetical protein